MGSPGSVRSLESVVADSLLICFRDAEQHPDDSHRHLRAEVRDEVEVPGADQRVKATGAELPYLGFERGHPLRSEDPRQQAPVDRVDRRVLEDQDARRHLDVGRISSRIPPRPDM